MNVQGQSVLQSRAPVQDSRCIQVHVIHCQATLRYQTSTNRAPGNNTFPDTTRGAPDFYSHFSCPGNQLHCR
ncbi:hypothetical protein ILYODFUR_021333 [Ilyodon furcidens]|uniref:Uncharacterized protein n=1 Tax=Ilyodon furcidens TaxID=33524 RepID=A0ABV0U928_9TELE